MLLKRTVVAWVMAMSYSASGLAQDASISEKIEQQVRSWISIEVVEKQHSLLTQVFHCQFFSAQPSLEIDGERLGYGEHLFFQNNGDLKRLPQPQSTEPMPQLQACLKPDFVANSQETAGQILDALQVLYAEGSRFDEPLRIIEKTDTGWHLINGSFFEERSGYVLKLNSDGTVAYLGRSLNL